MKYSSTVQELIVSRKSVRSYLDIPIEQSKKQELTNTMEALKNNIYRFYLVDFAFNEGAKIGTYGMIKGAKAYLVGIMKSSKGSDVHASFDFGCDFEKIILKATDLGLGTCWMAATFNSDDIERLVELEDDEQVVMVSPVGYAGDKRITEKMVRFFAKSDNRKPWDEIFFNLDDTMPLTRTEAGAYAQPLDMLRLAPSASNSQPWRVIKRNDKFEFYSASSSITSKPDQKIDISYNDLGIAKAHFELTAEALGLIGEWQMIDGDMSGFGELTFIGSWLCK